MSMNNLKQRQPELGLNCKTQARVDNTRLVRTLNFNDNAAWTLIANILKKELSSLQNVCYLFHFRTLSPVKDVHRLIDC